jgi:SAM-dependent methyltransferase
VPVKDLSSGFRLYRKSVLDDMTLAGRDFNVLQEILIRAITLGYRVAEVPFSYRRRESGSSHARLAVFAAQYLKTFGAMWRLRNSIESGDYDRRAFDSRIPLQRWWQRKRHGIILGWSREGGPVLDVGCGSSRILDDLPAGSVGIDPSMANLRWARRNGRAVAVGALPSIPVGCGRFTTVVCSQVIEHIPDSDEVFLEFRRLLAPGGVLILGTPDYSRLVWRVTEAFYRYLIPGGYADDHVTQYTCADLVARLERTGFAVIEKAYVGGGELILRCRRRD